MQKAQDEPKLKDFSLFLHLLLPPRVFLITYVYAHIHVHIYTYVFLLVWIRTTVARKVAFWVSFIQRLHLKLAESRRV